MARRGWVLAGGLVVVAAAVVVGSVAKDRHLDNVERQAMYMPTATIKDLMDAVVDPSADDVWNAVATTVEKSGINEKAPRTDKEWAEVRLGALRLVEGANLLLMPGRHVARPGEKSETPGVELEPGEMEALVRKDPAAWNARARALQDVSLEVLRTIEARDPQRLEDVGGRLDEACENCHKQYWYPNEKIPEFPSDATAVRTP